MSKAIIRVPLLETLNSFCSLGWLYVQTDALLRKNKLVLSWWITRKKEVKGHCSDTFILIFQFEISEMRFNLENRLHNP